MNDSGKKSSMGKVTCYHITKDPVRVTKRLKVSFRKDRAVILSPGGGHEAECLFTLIDLSEMGTGIFSSKLLSKGAPIIMQIESPAPLRISGSVVWSVPVNSGLNTRKFKFRSGIQFNFANEDEKNSLLKFMDCAQSGNWQAYNQSLAPPVVTPVAGVEVYGPPPAPSALTAELKAPEAAPADPAAVAPAPVAEVAPTPAPIAATETAPTNPDAPDKKAA